MAVKLNIKNVKPFKEFQLKYENKVIGIFGCKVYFGEELDKIREKYTELNTDNEREREINDLIKFEKEGDRTEQSFYEEREKRQNSIKEKSEKMNENLIQFLRDQIQFIRQVVVVTEEEKDILISDTRTVKPLESLWQDEKECLVVLLDSFLDVPELRDSFSEQVSSIILNIQLDEKVKNL